jgi:hypothetical protein
MDISTTWRLKLLEPSNLEEFAREMLYLTQVHRVQGNSGVLEDKGKMVNRHRDNS